MFVEGTEVTYRNLCGVVSFVCEWYVVIQLPAAGPKHGCPRLVVFPQYYSEIKSFKDSER